MTTLLINGWKRNFLTISFIKLLARNRLASAKDKVDQLLISGREIEIQFDDQEAAVVFCGLPRASGRSALDLRYQSDPNNPLGAV